MKKLLAVGLCLTTAATLTALCACGGNGGSSALTKTSDVYGMGAVSTVRLLGSETSARAIQTLSTAGRSLTEATADSSTDVKAQAEKFNEYFTALDNFLGEDIVNTVVEENTYADENYATFAKRLIINGKDIEGATVSYVMYYNENLAGTTTEDDETESRYTLEGVMVVDGKDYYLAGERTSEQETDEVEHELKIRAYADLADKTTYVEMAQEYSAETDESETEYVYSIVSKGNIIEQTAVEFETEKNGKKEEVEYEIEFRQGAAKGRYSIERETKNNKTEIKVKYNLGGKKGAFKIKRTQDGKYTYTFEDGSTVTL